MKSNSIDWSKVPTDGAKLFSKDLQQHRSPSDYLCQLLGTALLCTKGSRLPQLNRVLRFVGLPLMGCNDPEHHQMPDPEALNLGKVGLSAMAFSGQTLEKLDVAMQSSVLGGNFHLRKGAYWQSRSCNSHPGKGSKMPEFEEPSCRSAMQFSVFGGSCVSAKVHLGIFDCATAILE